MASRESITVRNPQANAIVERIHQVIGNIIVPSSYKTTTWRILGRVLSAAAFAVRSTYHTTQRLQDN
jgi:hypothetical protein